MKMATLMCHTGQVTTAKTTPMTRDTKGELSAVMRT